MIFLRTAWVVKMLKNVLLKIYYAIAFIVVIAECVFLVRGNTVFDIEDLPQGTFQYNATSPDGSTVLNIYKLENSICSSVRISAVRNDETHNIYWQTDEDEVTVEWAGGSIVFINGVPLDVAKGDTYDCRRGLSIFAEGSVYTDEG